MPTHEKHKKMPMKKHMMPAQHKAMGGPMPMKKSAKPKGRKR